MWTNLIAMLVGLSSTEPSGLVSWCGGEAAEAEAICAVLADQQTAWNEGDIPGFMQGYWMSDELRFASGGSVTLGWQPTLDRYLARYDSSEAMGVLSFTEVEVTVLGPQSALAFGRWTLTRESDAPNGLFSLVFQHIDGYWRIVHDHTSSAD